MTQHQMPEQEFRCPKCDDRLKTRHWAAICSKAGCGWCSMVAVIHEDKPKKDWKHKAVFTLITLAFAYCVWVIGRIIQEMFL